MRSGGRLLLCALAVIAVVAANAAAASARPPEFGRCVAKATRGGAGYTNSGCTKTTETKGKYEWLAGPGPKAGFTAQAKIVFSHAYVLCRSALFEEETAKKERTEAESASEPRKNELEEKASEHEAKAEAIYRKAEKTRSQCEMIVEDEQGKTPVRLVARSDRHIGCAAESTTGEYSGSTEVADVLIRLSECAKRGQPCQTSGAAEGEIVTSQLSGRLGIISGSGKKIKAGLALQPASEGPFAEFGCGETTFVLTGSVVRRVEANKMAKVETRDFKEKGGRQEPEGFLGEPDYLEASIGGAAPEDIGLDIKDEQISEEAIEVNTTV